MSLQRTQSAEIGLTRVPRPCRAFCDRAGILSQLYPTKLEMFARKPAPQILPARHEIPDPICYADPSNGG